MTERVSDKARGVTPLDRVRALQEEHGAHRDHAPAEFVSTIAEDRG